MFMQTVIMFFARGMNFGDLSLAINDLFVYLPAQLIPALAQSLTDKQFLPTEQKGWGYRAAKCNAEDNPFLVAGANQKGLIYNQDPEMPRTPWVEQAYWSGALDPSLGQSVSFPSAPQLKLRIEVLLWNDLREARYSTVYIFGRVRCDSNITGTRDSSPRFAQPVPVGEAEAPGEAPLRSNESKFSAGLNLLFFSVLVFSPAGNLVRGSGLNPI